jgi:hypothetical protein
MVNRTAMLLNISFCLFKKCMSIVLPGSVIALTFFVEPSISQEMMKPGSSKIFVIEQLSSDNKLTLKVYKADSNPVEIIDLSGLDITEEGKSSLNGSYYGDRSPDFKSMLLRKGYASIKLGSSVSEAEKNAQEQAKSSKLGKWAEPLPNKGFEINWLDALKLTGWLISAGIGACGVKATFDLLLKLFYCRPVDLIMLGLGSAGKTWIIARLMNPDISKGELDTLKITSVANRKTGTTMPVGKYEVIPTYVDTAGGQPGSQGKVMVSGKNKSIWVIVLSTTDKNGVYFDSNNDDKINNSHLDKQEGYLRFPLEMLELSICKKPEMVIICIGKFDIFSEDPPETKNAKLAEEKLKKLFEKHIYQINTTCEKQKITVIPVLCSALEKNWNTDRIEKCINTALYPKTK